MKNVRRKQQKAREPKTSGGNQKNTGTKSIRGEQKNAGTKKRPGETTKSAGTKNALGEQIIRRLAPDPYTKAKPVWGEQEPTEGARAPPSFRAAPS